MVGVYQEIIKEIGEERSKLKAQSVITLIRLIQSGDVSSKMAKEGFSSFVIEGKTPEEIFTEKQMSDDDELITIIQEIISKNPQAVKDYRGGNQKALGFFVGQVMQATRSQANPSKTNTLVLKLLKEKE